MIRHTTNKLAAFSAALALAGTAAFPAQAQFGRQTRTDAEIAFENAQKSVAKAAEARMAAQAGCAKGDIDACFTYADFQRTGTGGDQDLRGAAQSYRKVCDARDARGCAGLAYLTVTGRGVTQDAAAARQLYDKACDLGEISACAAYGNMLFTGAGGRKDTVAGTRLLTQACDRGYAWACTRMRDLGAFDPKDNVSERLRDIRRY